MKFKLGSMTFGEILDRGIKLLFARLGTFFTVSLILTSPMLFIQLVTPFVDASAILLTLIALLLQIIFVFVDQGAIVYIIGQEHIDQPVGIGAAIGYAFRRFGALFVTSFLVGIVVGLGFMLLLIPGLIFYTWYALSIQIVMMERKSGNAAMSRSKELTQGFRGRVFGVWFLIGLIGNLIIYLVTKGLESTIPDVSQVNTAVGVVEQFNTFNYIIHILINFLITTLFSTYGAICLTLLYFDLRVRKEGFDLELAARSEAPSPT